MTKRIVSLPLSEKEEKTVLIEVAEPEEGGVEAAAGIGKREQESISQALDDIKPLALIIVNQFQDLPTKEKEVKFGLKFTAQGNVMVATVGGEFNFEVTLRW